MAVCSSLACGGIMWAAASCMFLAARSSFLAFLFSRLALNSYGLIASSEKDQTVDIISMLC